MDIILQEDLKGNKSAEEELDYLGNKTSDKNTEVLQTVLLPYAMLCWDGWGKDSSIPPFLSAFEMTENSLKQLT